MFLNIHNISRRTIHQFSTSANAKMTTVATLPRLSSTALSEIILSQTSSENPTVAIVDVRDDDHIGGHIKGSMHCPSQSLDHKIPELVRKLENKDTVVFHCALSQQRGPSAALRYLRERERLLGAKQNLGGVAAAENKQGDGEWEDVEEKKEQKVYVLDRGFVGWQEKYGEDGRLTESYAKDLWKDGYWM